MNILPKTIREARAYLMSKGVKPSDISPRKFAAASKEMGKSFRETLNRLALLMAGGQGEGPAPSVTKDVDRLKPENAIGGEKISYADDPGVKDS